MSDITKNRIALITEDEGLNFESFKTFEDLLKRIVTFRMLELTYKNRMNPSAAFVQIQREVKAQLDKVYRAEKDEPDEEKVCPIAGGKSCLECTPRQIEACRREYG